MRDFFLSPAARAGLSTESRSSTMGERPITVLSLFFFLFFFSASGSEGVSPGIHTCQHNVVVGGRGGLVPTTPLEGWRAQRLSS